ncbi:alpha/beta fold hydrolase [Devosia sp. SL43]|uniref:alpha/beta fold hydrolase n=1 Tax=Devosia sp. SL43 TaxID=2806348 RepID=UPI001F469BBC|nr:alpha/beta hydrolase [Devosia sp. SL43]UJW85011.1 alpha/beta hydrolase [Devosia sp. SL43]
MVSRRALIGLGIASGALAATGGGTALAYSSAISKARVACDPSLSTIIPTRSGDLEYADAGSGTPLLMVHGTGGGFDQGLFFTRELLAKGYRIIAPSRFGYLRSSLPPDPSSANQADALVELLDHLHIDRIAVAGGSAGALSAIEFAIRHPDRCAALVPIVPASFTPDSEAITADNPPEGIPAAMALLRSDFLFWIGTAVASDLMVGTLLATDPALLKTVNAAEVARAREILRGILPVSRRADGLINDAQLAGHPAPSALESITAPTFAISVEDDRFGTAKAARHIAATVPNAQLTVFPSGGHIWLGHDHELFDQVDAFLTEIGYA